MGSDSTLPFIISSDLEEEGENFPEDKNTTTIIYELNGTEKDFNITCEGSGVPLPTLKFTLPKIVSMIFFKNRIRLLIILFIFLIF